jgi:hypothetical protein
VVTGEPTTESSCYFVLAVGGCCVLAALGSEADLAALLLGLVAGMRRSTGGGRWLERRQAKKEDRERERQREICMDGYLTLARSSAPRDERGSSLLTKRKAAKHAGLNEGKELNDGEEAVVVALRLERERWWCPLAAAPARQ